MIERHHDYQLSIPSVPVGGVFEVPLQLDSDAPFALRQVKSRNIGLNGWRFKSPRDLYQSSQLRTDLIDNGTGVVSGPNQGVNIYPQYVYPQNATISVDIGNPTNAPLVNARLLFRGAKLYADGALPAPTYPPRLSALPFTYEVVVGGVPVTGLSQNVPGLSTSAVLNNILNIKSDSDFALRYLAADPFLLVVDGGVNPPPQTFSELYVQLRDESRKPFSNEPIHVDDLFTQGSPATLQNNQANVFLPGLLRPEIYLLKEQALYFDVYRDDSALLNQFPVTVRFRFQGAKVFAR